MRLLLVDDEKEFVQTLAERLRTRGFDVTEAYNGEEAIEKVKTFNYDVTILDVQMPGISGIEVLKAIKDMKPLIEVVMLTGNATIESAIDGMKLGAYDFLLKPCKIESLLKKIDSAFDRKSEHEERIQKAMVKQLSTSPMSVFST
jgi:DNA-binding NtrC family response regulator